MKSKIKISLNAHSLFLPIAIFTSLSFIITLLYLCHFGLEMTDEGIYLNWISRPELYKTSVTLFGHFYNPIYLLLKENLVFLRQFNIISIVGLAWILSKQVLSMSLDKNTSFWQFHALSLSLATSAVLFFEIYWWIPTPSYNSLIYVASILLCIAFLRLLNQPTLSLFKEGSIFGFCIWLTFMAKPTSAIAITIIATGLLFSLKLNTLNFIQKLKIFAIAWIIGSFLLLMSAYYIDGNISDFIYRFVQGFEDINLLYNEDNFRFLPSYPVLTKEPFYWVLFSSLTLVIFVTLHLTTRKMKYLQLFIDMLTLSISLLIIFQYFSINLVHFNHMSNFFVLSFLLASLIYFIPKIRFSSLNTSELAFIVFLIILPYCASLGTRTNIGILTLRYGFFWIIASILLCNLVRKNTKVHTNIYTTLILSAQLLTIALVDQATMYPYRQIQAVRDQHNKLEIKNKNGKVISTINVSDKTFIQVDGLLELALENGYQYGDPILDLSGISPTVLYAIGATPIGAPWFVQGDSNYVSSVLSRISCEVLSKTWVLTSIGTGYSEHLLNPYGLRESLQQIPNIIDASNAYDMNLKQLLLKPSTQAETVFATCEEVHKEQTKNKEIIKQLLPNALASTTNIIGQALSYIDNKEIKSSISLLSAASSFIGDSAALYNNLCFSYGINGQFSLAKKACLQALIIDPNYILAQNNLNWVSSELN